MAVAESPRSGAPAPATDSLVASLLRGKQELEVDKLFKARSLSSG
jgi:hypothetical protein